MERHQYNMGIIGNCSYMAHIDDTANIKWMCWPNFESSFIFGELLDEDKGGHFLIHPKDDDYTTHQYYLTNTNILCTEFHCSDGKYRVTDYAPRFRQYDRRFKPLMLFRKVEPLEGNPEIFVSCRPKGDYGDRHPETLTGSNHLRYVGLEKPVRLTTNMPLSYVESERFFFLEDTQYLALSWGIPIEGPLESTAEEFLKSTRQYWEQWINEMSICNFHQEEVIRSSLALKLHQFQDTGAIIASGTTSLPEYPGEGRNWDYRYCWLRDAYYTVEAFNNLGNFDALRHYSGFVRNIVVDEQDRYNPVYPISLNTVILDERQLDLQGYLGNKPVRIGNQAQEHIQNDIYGEMLVSLLPLFTDERFAHKDHFGAERLTSFLLQKIEDKIDEPDAGLWEFRNIDQKHCFTFLFHWAGAHAARKVANYYDRPELAEKAEKLIARSEENIEACYDEKAGVYRQAEGEEDLDASLFQLITMHYLDPDSEKARRHLKRLEEGLRSKGALFYRYVRPDDFGKPTSSFLVCSFWYIEALACVGRLDDAREQFEEVLQYSNHLGLFSEDVDHRDGSQWGNFPQTYSHVGLVNSAFRIANKLDRPDFLVSDASKHS